MKSKQIIKSSIKKSTVAALGLILLICDFLAVSYFTMYSSSASVPLPVVKGGTGATIAREARRNLDLNSKSETMLAKYPIGSIYMSTSNTNPSTFFGGTWSAWGAGRVPVSVNASDTPINGSDKTGGSTDPLTYHTHTSNGYNSAGSGSVQVASRNKIAADPTDTKFNYTGDNTNHANWQPFITTYMWKRTA